MTLAVTFTAGNQAMLTAITPHSFLQTPTRATDDATEALAAANLRPQGMLVGARSLRALSCGHGTVSCDPPTPLVPSRYEPFGARIGGIGLSVVAVDRNGHPYVGDLLLDILEYRTLRSHALCGIPLEPQSFARLGALEERLRSRATDTISSWRVESRAYHRYECRSHARIVTPGPTPTLHDVEVRDLSAGGVKIATSSSLEPGEPLWLEFSGERGTLLLPARVAWSRSGAAGLMFAGAPQWCRASGR